MITSKWIGDMKIPLKRATAKIILFPPAIVTKLSLSQAMTMMLLIITAATSQSTREQAMTISKIPEVITFLLKAAQATITLLMVMILTI